MATAPKPSAPKTTFISKKRFGTPVVVLGPAQIKKGQVISVDERVKSFLEDRKKRTLDQAESSELELVSASNRRESARLLKEAENIEKTGQLPEEEESMSNEEKIRSAAEVAATAVEQGADPEQAMELASGKSKVIVVSPRGRNGGAADGVGGWIVVGDRPVRDPEGEYTFNQALQVIQTQKQPVKETGSELKELVQEIRQQNADRNNQQMLQITKTLESLAEKINNPPKKEEHPTAVSRPVMMPQIIKMNPNGSGFERVRLEEGEVFVIPPPPVDNGHIDEQRRHNQEIERIEQEKLKTEAELKQANNKIITETSGKLVEVAGGIIGEIIASRGSGPAKTQPVKNNVMYKKCDSCEFDIPVPPNAWHITCPQCGEQYTDWSKAPESARIEYENREKVLKKPSTPPPTTIINQPTAASPVAPPVVQPKITVNGEEIPDEPNK